MTNTPHGGKRCGAGRKTKFGEPMGHLRVPESLKPLLAQALDQYRERLKLQRANLSPAALNPSVHPIQQVLTRLSAGFPSPAEGVLDDGVDLNTLLVPNPPATFFYTVERDADSMERMGISGGDRLIVDRSIQPRTGHVVVAMINGEGATVKELQIRGGVTRLIPHSLNPAHKPRTFREGDELLIVGVVTSCIKRFPS